MPPFALAIMEEFRNPDHWFNKDMVLRQAAIELDSDLQAQGVPLGRARVNFVEDRLRETFPERFFDVPERKRRWSDISDALERREAKNRSRRSTKTPRSVAGRP